VRHRSGTWAAAHTPCRLSPDSAGESSIGSLVLAGADAAAMRAIAEAML